MEADGWCVCWHISANAGVFLCMPLKKVHCTAYRKPAEAVVQGFDGDNRETDRDPAGGCKLKVRDCKRVVVADRCAGVASG